MNVTVNRFGDLPVFDLRPRLPRQPVPKSPLIRPRTTALTVHYNGPPVLPTRQRWPGLLDQLLIDARYQMAPGALGAPSGGDGIQYHLCVDADGKIYQLRDLTDSLWHCGDKTGNTESLSVHLPLGGSQDTTADQWAALARLMDEAQRVYGFTRDRCLGHREWPSAQSVCPGAVIMARLKAWRAQISHQPGVAYIVRDIAVANVRQGPGRRYLVAATMYGGDTLVYKNVVSGETIAGNNQWLHRADDLGFVHSSLVGW